MNNIVKERRLREFELQGDALRDAAKEARTNMTPREVSFMLALGEIGVRFHVQKIFKFKSLPKARAVSFYLPDIDVAVELGVSNYWRKRGTPDHFHRLEQFKTEYPSMRFWRFRRNEIRRGPGLVRMLKNDLALRFNFHGS